MCFSLSDNIKKPYFLTHDKISVMSRAMCHTAVAQLNASYPAVHPIQVTAQFPLPALKKKKKKPQSQRVHSTLARKNKIKIKITTAKKPLGVSCEQILCAFPDARNGAPGPDSPLWFMSQSFRVSSNPAVSCERKTKVYTEKEEKIAKVCYRFQTEAKNALIVRRLEVPTHRPTHRAGFQPIAWKRRRNSEKTVSHKLLLPDLHPYLNSSVHFAQIFADPDDIPNMTRSWINSSGRYVAERKRHFYRIEFFLSSKFGKWSHHCWEGWGGSCVSPKALPSKKQQDTVPER